MSQIIATDRQRLEQDILVEMFELDVTKYGSGILRFSPTSIGGQAIVFNGYTYSPIPIQAEGFQWNGSGTLPQPTLTIGVKDMAFFSLIAESKDLVGCDITRVRTYRKYLDDGSHPNPTAQFAPDHYRVNKKTQQTRNTLVFELTPKSDQEGRMVPALQVIRDTCRHRFRRWNGSSWDYTGVTCPYAGSAMFDENGLTTQDPFKAHCGRRLSDCTKHFGQHAVLPFRGFPGVGRI